MNWGDPLGLEILHTPGGTGVKSMIPMEICFQDRAPDYYALSFSLVIIGATFEVDKFGNIYIAPVHFTYGWKDIDVSLFAGWLDRCGEIDEEDLEKFLSEWSFSGHGGFGFGGGYTFVPGQGKAFELGFTTPNIGGSAPYSRREKWPF